MTALPAIASWVVAAVLLGTGPAAGACVAAVTGLAALVTAVARLWPVVAVLVCVAGTAAAVAFRLEAVSEGPVPLVAARRGVAVVELALSGDPRPHVPQGGVVRQDGVIVNATLEMIGSHRVRAPVLVLASGQAWTALLPSQRVRVTARLVPADHAELLAAIVQVRSPPEVISGPSTVQKIAGRLRQGLRQATDQLPPAERGLVPGLVIGDTARMDDQLREDFKTAGLSHLTAVSGANLAITAGAAIALSRAAGFPLAVRALLATVAMLAFTVVARPSPSVLRALLMGLIGATALATGRPRVGFGALSVTVLVLILFDPGLAREYGFALSVFATAGILLLAPRWRDRMERRMPRLVAESIAVPAAAQAACTPLLVLMSGQVSLVAVPANLLAAAAVPPATVLGFAATLVSPVWSGAGEWLGLLAGLCARWIVLVAKMAAGLPGASLAWPGGMGGLALLAGAAVVIGVATVFAARCRAARMLMLAAAVGAIFSVIAVRGANGWPPPGWLLVACDVGQGDALAIAAGDGSAVVVDAGPDPVVTDRCLRALNVRRVPLLVLTHPHADHIGGLSGVLRGRWVGSVVVSPFSGPATEMARMPAPRGGIRVSASVTGTRWMFNQMEITVLGPVMQPAPKAGGSAANNASVVLYVRWPRGSALLAGDMETEAQGALAGRELPQADILKVPHHGSRRQDPAFLSRVRARVALISVGGDNRYGHPAPITLARLRERGMRIYRTDLSGDVAVVAHEKGLAVVARGPP